MSKILTSLDFSRGPEMKNRFMLAPLTNSQSHEDGIMSEEEFHWLTKRAEGGFGLTMTCASHVQAIGKGFPGQMGVFSDDHLEGLTRLANRINSLDSISIVQLHHAGMRSPKELIGEDPVCPSTNEEFSARALSLDEVKMLRDDFIALMTKVNNTIKSKYPTDNHHCPVFKRLTYSLAYVEVEKCFQEIIALLKSETGSEDWTYDEGPCGPKIENSLKYADKFVENWDTWNKKRMMKQKQKRFREAQEAKQLYNKVIKQGYGAKQAMEMIKT